MKAAELEAACIVNFDVVGDLIAAGDRDGAKRVLDENDNLAADLKKLKSADADGISSLSRAYARLNTILSYPLIDIEWLAANKASLKEEINACLSDLNRAKSGLVNKALLNTCSGLLKNVSAIQKVTKRGGAL